MSKPTDYNINIAISAIDILTGKALYFYFIYEDFQNDKMSVV